MSMKFFDRALAAMLCATLVSSLMPAKALAVFATGPDAAEGDALIVLDDEGDNPSGGLITIDDTSVVELPVDGLLIGGEPVEDGATDDEGAGGSLLVEQDSTESLVDEEPIEQGEKGDGEQSNDALVPQEDVVEPQGVAPKSDAEAMVGMSSSRANRLAPNDDWGLEAQASLSKYEQYALGSYGFYHWLANTYKPTAATAWIAADARDAMKVINKSAYSKYTKRGTTDDATSHKNFKAALDMFPTLNRLRKQDDNFKNLQTVRANSTMMATAQVHANVSSQTQEHEVNETVDVPLAKATLENLAWGYGDEGDGPFYGWYHDEKKNYDAYRSHILKKYKVDIADDSQIEDYYNLPDSATNDDSFGKTGHYATTVMRGATTWSFATEERRIYVQPYKEVLGGIAYNTTGWSTWALEMDGLDEDDTSSRGSCSIAAYAKLYRQYLAWVRTDLSSARVASVGKQTYTGKVLRPELVVKQGGRTLEAGTDYVVSYKNNVKVGTATAVIKGKGAYKGSKSVEFEIVKPVVASYRTHVQRIGWQGWKRSGAMSGTSGRGLRLEAINLRLQDTPYKGGIQYCTHIQGIGWQGWKRDGAMSGTSGRGLRLEAIRIKLYGSMAKYYDVYYRVHAQQFGWMGWAKNGQEAGTAGFAYRLEAVQVILVKKGAKRPTDVYKGVAQMTAARFKQR